MGKVEIVGGSGEQAAPARKHRRRKTAVYLRAFGGLQAAALARRVHADQAVDLFFGNPEAGIAHLERGEDAFLKKFGQALARNLFDQAAEHVMRQAVPEAFAGLADERQLREFLQELFG